MPKRFTDAELAAEYWGFEWMNEPEVDRQRIFAVERFATHPHFDEAPA